MSDTQAARAAWQGTAPEAAARWRRGCWGCDDADPVLDRHFVRGGRVGSMFTDPAWYQSLQRPNWAPPSSVFGPLWTIFYGLVGIAAWLVWRRAGCDAASTALVLFLVQLVFNAAWSWFFFGPRRAELGFADLVLLWILILATIMTFRQHSKLGRLAEVTYAGR